MKKNLNTLPFNDTIVQESLSAFEQQQLSQLQQVLPLHGGDIQSASKRYGIPAKHWIDLSTGMNPQPYPVPKLPAQVFEELPYWQPEFLTASKRYYGQKDFLAISGSQAVIQILPELLNANNKGDSLAVLLPEVGYQEHAKQWGLAGNTLNLYPSDNADKMIFDIDRQLAKNKKQHLVIIRPNNPTGVSIDTRQLCQWASILEAGAKLIVDEAFIDLVSQESLLNLDIVPDNIIVLRSFGKFFGLAGLRLGFVFSHPSLLNEIREKTGIWQVNGPAQFIATQALNDVLWQNRALQNIAANACLTEQLFAALEKSFPIKLFVNAQLFLSYSTNISWAIALNDALAKAGILTRVVKLDKRQALLRVGSVNGSNEDDVSRIKAIIKQLCLLDSLTAVLTFSPDIKL